jgi:glycosyltransferase involved in cell wall biosynthesis
MVSSMSPGAQEDACPISVVIPTHNRSSDCRRAVASALAQSPAPIEVLVCDDGSTDDTQRVFEQIELEDPRVRYFRVTPGRGTPGPARNMGVAAARGEWVAMLDDDDWWLPGKLAAQMPFLVNAEYDVVASDAITADGTRYFGPTNGPTFPDRAELERRNPLIISSAVIRRGAIVDAEGFDETPRMKSVADYDLWLRLADRGARFVVVDGAFVHYDDVSGQRLSSALLQTRLATVTLHWRRWKRAPADREVARAMLRAVVTTAPLAIRVLRLRLRPR